MLGMKSSRSPVIVLSLDLLGQTRGKSLGLPTRNTLFDGFHCFGRTVREVGRQRTDFAFSRARIHVSKRDCDSDLKVTSSGLATARLCEAR